MEEIINYYEKLKASNVFETKPVFKMENSEFVIEKSKELYTQILKEKEKVNSGSFMYQGNNNYGNNYFKSKAESGEKKLSFNSGSSTKIPLTNPLAGMCKNVNKFDEHKTNVEPVTLCFNSVSLNNQK